MYCRWKLQWSHLLMFGDTGHTQNQLSICSFLPFYDHFFLLTFLFWYCRWHGIPAGQVLFIVLNVKSEVTQSCPTLCDPMEYSLLGSFIHGIFQARILGWVVISFSRGSSQPRDRTRVSCIAGRLFTAWATRESGEFIVLVYIKYLNHWKTLSWSAYSFVSCLTCPDNPMGVSHCRSALPMQSGARVWWCRGWRPGSFSWSVTLWWHCPSLQGPGLSHGNDRFYYTLFKGSFIPKILQTYWLNKQQLREWDLSPYPRLELQFSHFSSLWHLVNDLPFMGSLVVQLVKNPPAMWETWARSLGLKDPLEKRTVIHSSILAWRIPWTV